MCRQWIVLLCGGLASAIGCQPPVPPAPVPATAPAPATRPGPMPRWEPAIRRFEQADRKSPPPKDAILFVGSSSIVNWKTGECFPDMTTINRGFGGSAVADVLYYVDRIVIPYRPRIIVFYAGDNDIAGGAPPQRVAEDYIAFVKRVRAALPQTRIIFIAIKPSIARWKLVEKMRQANRLMAEFSRGDPRLAFVDVDAPMIGPDGRPRRDLFVPDGLHLNDKGYELWTSLLRPLLR